MRFHRFCASVLLYAALPASAVYLNPDGLGQALIYPYYTARSGDGNPFNTYISLANTASHAKVVRVRFREAENGREVAGFNVFLAPLDMWTGAVVPTLHGAKLLTADRSCVEPAMPALTPKVAQLEFVSSAYTGANADGGGPGLDRTREGYVEVLEMASVATGSDTEEAVASYGGEPVDCGFVRDAANVTPDLEAPKGGLMGTLTLINVANGEDFTVIADALGDLAAQPYFRPGADPYPDFDAVEIDPRSRMMVDGKWAYDLQWSSGVDAVSSVLMATHVFNEYVMDRGTASQTDWVLTYPTRRFFPDPNALFTNDEHGNLEFIYADRTGRAALNWPCADFPEPTPCLEHYRLRPVNVIALSSGENPSVSLLGSKRLLPQWIGALFPGFEAGSVSIRHVYWLSDGPRLLSLPTSTEHDLATGTTTVGTFSVKGLPVTGLALRTFRNGTLNCDGRKCQGNYGGSFSHRYKRDVWPFTP